MEDGDSVLVTAYVSREIGNMVQWETVTSFLVSFQDLGAFLEKIGVGFESLSDLTFDPETFNSLNARMPIFGFEEILELGIPNAKRFREGCTGMFLLQPIERFLAHV